MTQKNFKRVEHWDNVFMQEFSKESDRASVILAVAMLDQALETLLKTYLVPTDSSEDRLLDGAYAPLSSFSARIDLCYRLSLISARFCRDLHIIRRIRNEFAHNVTGCNFGSSGVRNRIIELMRSSRIDEQFPEFREQYADGAKGDFQMNVSWMLWQLWSLAEHSSPLEARSIESFYVFENNDEDKGETGDTVLKENEN
jgi:DNA-binding MltR family transcriptional regulator